MSFRWQLTLLMSLCGGLTICLAMGATSALMMRQDARYQSSLSAAARMAKDRIDKGLPASSLDAANELLLLRAQQYGTYSRLRLRVLLSIALVSAVLGAGIAALVAGRLSRPLQGISRAAGQVAAGCLSARAPQDPRAAREVRSLIADFNSMAGSIERASRQMNETSAAIAHELRTPVAILRGRMEGMREGLFETHAASVGNLIPQVELLGRIIDDLSLISLASAGQFRVQLEPLDLASTLNDFLDRIETVSKAQGIAIRRDLHPAPVLADPARLQQVILALLDNVARHAAVGAVAFISCGKTHGSSILRVADHGPGLDEDSRSRLFEPFWRLDDSRSRERGGTGLGLAVVAAIVRAHGGKVEALSNDGNALSIQIRLPVREA